MMPHKRSCGNLGGDGKIGGMIVALGIMQAELQEKRQWVPKGRFVKGLSLVNMLPGAGATQLSIFLGHARDQTHDGWCDIGSVAEPPDVAPWRQGNPLTHLHLSQY